MVYSSVILQKIRDIRLNGRNVLTIPNQTRAGKIFKCTIFVVYGGVMFFTGVAPSVTESIISLIITSGVAGG